MDSPRFERQIEGVLADLDIPVLATISFDRYDPTSLDVNVRVLATDSRPSSALHEYFASGRGRVVDPKTNEPLVRFLYVSRSVIKAHDVSLTVGRVDVGISDQPPRNPISLWFLGEIVPSGILIKPHSRMTSYTGEIEIDNVFDGNVEVTSSTLGPIDVGHRVLHYSTKEHGNDVLHCVERATASGTIELSPELSLADANEALLSKANAICTALSFCYRHRVGVYEIRYESRSSPTALTRIRQHSIVEKERREELIHVRDLMNGGLDRIISGLQCSEVQDALTNCIWFLASSYEARIESSYFLCFSALESAVDANLLKSDRILLGDSKWKKVAGDLRGALKECADKYVIPDETLEQMKAKLPEIRRRPWIEKALAACAKLDDVENSIWPFGLREGLEKAARRRNALFHSATVEDPWDMHADMIRVRALTERLIAKKIGWPASAFHVWHDQELKWMNKNAPPP